MIDSPNRLMPLSEIHELTGLSVGLLRKYARQGVLPARKIGKEHRVSVRDYVIWLNSQPSSSPLTTPSRASV